MIAPNRYQEQIMNLSYLDMIRERNKLISFLQAYEKAKMAGDRSDPAWNCHPQPNVMYQVYFDYLAALCSVMRKKYNQEYVWGNRSLQQDVNEERNSHI